MKRIPMVLITLLLFFSMPDRTLARERGADGNYDHRKSSHFHLFQDVDIDQRSGWYGSIQFERNVLKALEQSYDRLARDFGLRPARPIVVTIHDPEIFDRRFSGLFRFPIAGFFGGEIHIRGDVRVTYALERVLHHEYFHAALHQEASPFRTPAWFNEGLAEWFELRATGTRGLSLEKWALLRAQYQQEGILPLQTLMEPTFGALGPEQAALAYIQSLAMIDLLSQSGGEPKLARCLEITVREEDLARGLKKTYGISLAELEEKLHQALR